MVDKPKCNKCGERDVFAKKLCSRCYGQKWRAERNAEREAAAPKLLTTGNATESELAPITVDGEIVAEEPKSIEIPVPEVHLVARNPAEMQAAQASLKAWLEQRLAQTEKEVSETNAALSEARKYNWSTGALAAARNRAVDDETYYLKLLQAVEAGYTLIPDFPVDVFAIRTMGKLKNRYRDSRYDGHAPTPTERAECAPLGAGSYVSPELEASRWTYVDTRADGSKHTVFVTDPYAYKEVAFPLVAARPMVMNATAQAMALKTFDQLGVCLPVQNSAKGRQVQHRPQARAATAGDPLIIGQVLRKNQGGKQKCVSFIIAWHLNLNEL